MNTIDERLIELSELRIGNALMYKGELVCVTMISLDIDDEYQETIGFVKYGTSSNEIADWNRSLVEDLKRIQLNSVWLGRLGFIEDKRGWSSEGFRLIKYKDDLVIGLYNDQIVNYTPIKYVHQLQNAYFFPHMSKELTIK